jgi:RNA polymerase sigma-70 factor (ECF subfamily)
MHEDLRSGWERARAASPRVSIAADEFVRYWQERLGERDPTGWRVEDLYVACGCAAGSPAALAEFEERFLSEVPSFVSRVDSSRAFADEVKQELRQRLLLPREGGPPRIADYTGQGPLARWVQVTALRTALNLRRGGGRLEPVVEDRLAAQSPELGYLRESKKAAFEEALRAALASITPRERTLLKLHLLDGLSTPRIAELWRTHRTTVRRQLNECHSRLHGAMRAHLRERLRLEEHELDSFLRTSKSEIDLSLGPLLADEG